MLGTADSRQSARPPEHARELESIVLQDHTGRDVRLGDLWDDRPAVLVFLRHYGCLFCRDHAVKLYRHRHGFEQLGVRLVLIGQGTPAHAEDFRRSQTVDLPLLVDPDRRAFEAAGAKVATLAEIYRPGLIAKSIRLSLASRLRPGSIVVAPGRNRDHPAQLGGVLIIAPEGSVRYAYLSDDAGDNPKPREVIAAARAIRPHVARRSDDRASAPEPVAAATDGDGNGAVATPG